MNVIVWDLETVPDLRGFAAANGLDGKSDDDVRAELGDRMSRALWTERGERTEYCPNSRLITGIELADSSSRDAPAIFFQAIST